MTKNAGKNHSPELLEQMERELELQLRVVAARREALPAGGFDPKLAASTAAVAKAITQVQAERRLQERDRGDGLTAKSIEEIASYVRTLPEADRRWLVDEITGVHDDEPLL